MDVNVNFAYIDSFIGVMYVLYSGITELIVFSTAINTLATSVFMAVGAQGDAALILLATSLYVPLGKSAL